MEPLADEVPETIDRRDQYVTLEYDFLKHITSLSLIAIGGAMTFAGSIFAGVPDQSRLWQAVAVLIGAGMIAFSGQQKLLKLLRTGKPVGRAVSVYRDLALLAFGFGTGMLVVFAYATVTKPRAAADQARRTAVPVTATISIDSEAPKAE